MSESPKSESIRRTDLQPLFKWTGSKQRMLAQYSPVFFPPRFDRFVDLFAGGLTNTLLVAQRYPDVPLVINDANEELISLYSALRDSEREVVAVWRRCVREWLKRDSVEDRRRLYYKWRDEYCLHFEAKSASRLSGLLLFMLQVNFNGMWKSYKKCNRRYSTPPGTCAQGPRFFHEERIHAVAELLQRPTTELHCGDFASVPLRDGDFVYADPPYRDSIVDYQGGFTEDDQLRLVHHLNAHKGTFAYSNKDCGDGFFEKHFTSVDVHPMSATYTAGRGASTHNVTEVLITRHIVPTAESNT